MKNRIICVVACLMMLVGCVVLCSCSEADKVNRNISKQANYFEAERRITVYNARTDNVILEMEGAMSISNNDNNELVCTVKTGLNEYNRKLCVKYHTSAIAMDRLLRRAVDYAVVRKQTHGPLYYEVLGDTPRQAMPLKQFLYISARYLMREEAQ